MLDYHLRRLRRPALLHPFRLGVPRPRLVQGRGGTAPCRARHRLCAETVRRRHHPAAVHLGLPRTPGVHLGERRHHLAPGGAHLPARRAIPPPQGEPLRREERFLLAQTSGLGLELAGKPRRREAGRQAMQSVPSQILPLRRDQDPPDPPRVRRPIQGTRRPLGGTPSGKRHPGRAGRRAGATGCVRGRLDPGAAPPGPGRRAGGRHLPAADGQLGAQGQPQLGPVGHV